MIQADYQTRTLQYDREMLANGIKDLNAQYEFDKQTVLANGVMNVTYAGAMGGMSGNPIAAGMGAGMAAVSICNLNVCDRQESAE